MVRDTMAVLPRRQLLLGTVVAVLTATAGTSAAVTFTPIRPETCPATTNIAWNYRIGGKTGVFDLPSDPNCSGWPANPCPHYINNINNPRFFIANSWVGFAAFRVSFFSTEPNFDFVRWGIDGFAPAQATGSVAPGTTFWASTSWSFSGSRGTLNFTTDGSVTYEGVAFDQVQVCSSLSAIDTHGPSNLDLKRRFHGVLLGTNDVVYMQFPATASNHYPITLWEDTSAGHDFDLYARCGALPTPTQYDWIGFSGNDQEYIDVTNCNGTVYLAISAYNGSGPFSIVRGTHGSGGHTANLRAGTEFVATAANMATFAATLRGGARHFYGSTEGEQVIGQIDLYNSAGCGSTSCGGAPCDICFRTAGGTANASCNGSVNVFTGYWADPEGLSHEFGHYKYCSGDEYANGGGTWNCGHSNMASPWGDQNNYCVNMDHERDKTPGAPATGLSSVMSQASAAGKAIDVHNVTFDNFDYENFDFNFLVGNVITH
jgi:hypothetical protein